MLYIVLGVAVLIVLTYFFAWLPVGAHPSINSSEDFDG